MLYFLTFHRIIYTSRCKISRYGWVGPAECRLTPWRGRRDDTEERVRGMLLDS